MIPLSICVKRSLFFILRLATRLLPNWFINADSANNIPATQPQSHHIWNIIAPSATTIHTKISKKDQFTSMSLCTQWSIPFQIILFVFPVPSSSILLLSASINLTKYFSYKDISILLRKVIEANLPKNITRIFITQINPSRKINFFVICRSETCKKSITYFMPVARITHWIPRHKLLRKSQKDCFFAALIGERKFFKKSIRKI